MSKTVGATVRPLANDVPVTPMLTNPVLCVATSAMSTGRPLQLVLPPGLDRGLPAVAGRLVARHGLGRSAAGGARTYPCCGERRQEQDQQPERERCDEALDARYTSLHLCLPTCAGSR